MSSFILIKPEVEAVFVTVLQKIRRSHSLSARGTRTSESNPSYTTIIHEVDTIYFGLALNLKEEALYYSKTGLEGNCEIRRASLDGSNQTVVISVGNHFAAGLSLDLEASRIYWAEYFPNNSINSADLNGGNARDAMVQLWWWISIWNRCFR